MINITKNSSSFQDLKTSPKFKQQSLVFQNNPEPKLDLQKEIAQNYELNKHKPQNKIKKIGSISQNQKISLQLNSYEDLPTNNSYNNKDENFHNFQKIYSTKKIQNLGNQAYRSCIPLQSGDLSVKNQDQFYIGKGYTDQIKNPNKIKKPLQKKNIFNIRQNNNSHKLYQQNTKQVSKTMIQNKDFQIKNQPQQQQYKSQTPRNKSYSNNSQVVLKTYQPQIQNQNSPRFQEQMPFFQVIQKKQSQSKNKKIQNSIEIKLQQEQLSNNLSNTSKQKRTNLQNNNAIKNNLQQNQDNAAQTQYNMSYNLKSNYFSHQPTQYQQEFLINSIKSQQSNKKTELNNYRFSLSPQKKNSTVISFNILPKLDKTLSQKNYEKNQDHWSFKEFGFKSQSQLFKNSKNNTSKLNTLNQQDIQSSNIEYQNSQLLQSQSNLQNQTNNNLNINTNNSMLQQSNILSALNSLSTDRKSLRQLFVPKKSMNTTMNTTFTNNKKVQPVLPQTEHKILILENDITKQYNMLNEQDQQLKQFVLKRKEIKLTDEYKFNKQEEKTIEQIEKEQKLRDRERELQKEKEEKLMVNKQKYKDNDVVFDDIDGEDNGEIKQTQKLAADINWEFYNISEGQNAYKVIKKTEEDEDDITRFLDEKKNLTSEVEIMMDIFTPKIRRDGVFQKKIFELFYTVDYFLFHFERFIKLVIDVLSACEHKSKKDSEKYKNLAENEAKEKRLQFKITKKMFDELLNFFDIAIKQKYDYSQFVVNDYLVHFNRFSEKILLYKDITTELGGPEVSKTIISEAILYFYLKENIMKIFKQAQIEIQIYQDEFVKLLGFIFDTEKPNIDMIKTSLKELHKDLNFTYKEFFQLKFCFWEVLSNNGELGIEYRKNNVNPTTKLNILKYLEDCREYIVSDFIIPPQIQNNYQRLKQFEDFEWRVSIDMKCIEPFVNDDTGTVLQIFTQRIFNWTVLNQKNTDWILYIEQGVIQMSENVFSRFTKYIIQGLLQKSISCDFVRQVQIRCDHLMEYLNIKQSKLLKIGGPNKIQQITKEGLNGLKKVNGFRDIIEENYQIKEKQQLIWDHENKLITKNIDTNWLDFIIITYLSSNDCYNTLDFRAGIQLNFQKFYKEPQYLIIDKKIKQKPFVSALLEMNKMVMTKILGQDKKIGYITDSILIEFDCHKNV